MNTKPYNKPTLGGTIPFAALSQQPLGVACNDMDWHKYFSYDPKTGDLVWKTQERELFRTERDFRAWNAQRAGKVAGYRATRVGGRPMALVLRFKLNTYCVHRVIWEMLHGKIPPGMVIDHINGNPFDNRLSNMRLATPSENSRNRGPAKNNACGLKGVCRLPSGSFQAQIQVNGKNIYLGSFPTAEAAHATYATYAKELHGKFARTK